MSDPSAPLPVWEGLAQAISRDPPGKNYLIGLDNWTEEARQAFRDRVQWLRKQRAAAN